MILRVNQDFFGNDSIRIIFQRLFIGSFVGLAVAVASFTLFIFSPMWDLT